MLNNKDSVSASCLYEFRVRKLINRKQQSKLNPHILDVLVNILVLFVSSSSTLPHRPYYPDCRIFADTPCEVYVTSVMHRLRQEEEEEEEKKQHLSWTDSPVS